MINRVLGIIVEKNPSVVIVDVGGVGYEIGIPVSTFSKLPQIGEKVLLYTHLYIGKMPTNFSDFLKKWREVYLARSSKLVG